MTKHKKLIRKTYLFLLVALQIFCLQAQEYHPPLDSRLLLSGTFGELRSNHFHTGIDLKTKGVEGLPIYAIEKGYISRIKVSSFGYGKALYISHPDGNTSVYAHLKNFSVKIDSLVQKEHYNRESFEINIYPKENEIIINKGEVIALSGNSGSSAGAHLHFEIRDTYSEKPLNPLDFNFKVLDNLAPVIKKIKILDLTNPLKEIGNIVKVNKKEKKYHLEGPIKVSEKIGVAINTYDISNDCYNKNGVNSIKLFLDSTLIYELVMDKLDFSTNKYINAHIDFREKKENKSKYHKCYKLPHNKLNNYKTLVNNGFIKLKDTNIHNLLLEASDSYGNISRLTFEIQLDTIKSEIIKNDIDTMETKYFSWLKENYFKTNNFSIEVPQKSLYQSINFEFQRKDSIKGLMSQIYMCHHDFIPMHKKALISIKAQINDKLRDKAYIAKIVNNKFYYIGGKWKNSYLTSKISEFGNYAIAIDTIKPEIRGVNIYPGKILKKQKTLKCTISDKDSGIKKYNATLNNEWILMSYDHKTKLLKYNFDDKIKKGKNILEIKVEDQRNNINIYYAEFNY